MQHVLCSTQLLNYLIRYLNKTVLDRPFTTKLKFQTWKLDTRKACVTLAQICEETLFVLEDKKARERVTTYLGYKRRLCLQKRNFFEFFKLFFSIDQSPACFEDGCLELSLRTSLNLSRYCCDKVLTAKNLKHFHVSF